MCNKLVVRLQEDVALACLESRQGDVQGDTESVGFEEGSWQGWVQGILSQTSARSTSSFTGALCVHAKSLQSCLTLCEPVDCSPPGPSVHRILQARILEWVSMPSSKGSSDPGIGPASLTSLALGGYFTTSTTWEAQSTHTPMLSLSFLLPLL